jgi:hypothetical protein
MVEQLAEALDRQMSGLGPKDDTPQRDSWGAPAPLQAQDSFRRRSFDKRRSLDQGTARPVVSHTVRDRSNSLSDDCAPDCAQAARGALFRQHSFSEKAMMPRTGSNSSSASRTGSGRSTPKGHSPLGALREKQRSEQLQRVLEAKAAKKQQLRDYVATQDFDEMSGQEQAMWWSGSSRSLVHDGLLEEYVDSEAAGSLLGMGGFQRTESVVSPEQSAAAMRSRSSRTSLDSRGRPSLDSRKSLDSRGSLEFRGSSEIRRSFDRSSHSRGSSESIKRPIKSQSLCIDERTPPPLMSLFDDEDFC